jgi:5-methylcytosine-specific restriction endonuclease McrA
MAGAAHVSRPSDAAVAALLDALGVDSDSYNGFVAWCLAEELVAVLTDLVVHDPAHESGPLWNRPDGRKHFRRILHQQTGRSWRDDDEERLFDRVRMASVQHDRKPIRTDDLLRLLWTTPHVCARCGRRPPEIKLHVDHVFPASRGGSSQYDNLQFLCADCNLTKSNKLEQEDLWLRSV